MMFYQYILFLLSGETFKIWPVQGPFVQLVVYQGESRSLDLDLDLVGFDCYFAVLLILNNAIYESSKWGLFHISNLLDLL